jgi:heat-inducible transcriptional repressor
MEQPEFADIRKASQFLSMLENKERVRNILLAHIPTKGVRITIGAESVCKWTKNYALITAICKKGKESAGVLGVIGPLRMPYRKIVPMIKYTIDVVSNTWRNHG